MFNLTWLIPQMVPLFQYSLKSTKSFINDISRIASLLSWQKLIYQNLSVMSSAAECKADSSIYYLLESSLSYHIKPPLSSTGM